MPELLIKYRSKRTLAALLDFSKYFNFSVVVPAKTSEELNINGVTIVPADSSIDTSSLEKIFSNKNIDANQLRQDAWQRNK